MLIDCVDLSFNLVFSVCDFRPKVDEISLLSVNSSSFATTNQAVRMSATFYITGWLAIYFSEGAWSLDIGRFLTGYRIGVFSYVKSRQKSLWRAYNTKSVSFCNRNNYKLEDT